MAAVVQKYGTPLYCACFLSEELLVVGGGGGKKGCGIPNRLVVARWANGELGAQPVATHVTGDEPPQRLALHPDGGTLVVALSSGLLLLRVRLTRASDGAGGCELEAAPLPPAASSLPPCEPKCLAFSPDGTRLAVGCEDGRLRLHAWPSLALLCDRPAAHGDAVSDADFSDDGLQLLTTGNEAAGSGGGAAVWAVARDGGALTRLLWLPPPPARSRARGGRAVFRGARFGRGAALGCAFTGLNVGGAGRVVAWRSATWAQLSDSAALDTPLTALTASPTGGLVAVGGCEGAVALLGGSAPRWALRPRLAHTQAHMVFVTALSFAPSGALLASVSGAGSCRVTAAPGRRSAAAAALRHALLFLAQLLLAALLLRIVKVLFLDA